MVPNRISCRWPKPVGPVWKTRRFPFTCLRQNNGLNALTGLFIRFLGYWLFLFKHIRFFRCSGTPSNMTISLGHCEAVPTHIAVSLFSVLTSRDAAEKNKIE